MQGDYEVVDILAWCLAIYGLVACFSHLRCHAALKFTQVAYRSFARKHEMTKANLRRKTALLRVLESRLDKREDALHDLHERSQEKARKAPLFFSPNVSYTFFFHLHVLLSVF